MTTIHKIARLLDAEAFSERASEHIEWCKHYGIPCDRDYPEMTLSYTYLGQQYAQRRRNAERLAKKIVGIVVKDIS